MSSRHPVVARSALSVTEARSVDLLRDGLGLREEQQVVAATGLRVGTRHIEAAEGMAADHRAGALAVEVQVADVELTLRAGDALAVAGEERAGQTILGAVGDVE